MFACAATSALFTTRRLIPKLSACTCIQTTGSQRKILSRNMEWLQTWSGLVIGCTEHFNTHLVTTIYYSANANSHTAVHYSKYEVFLVGSVFTGCCLVTASNAADSSASVFTSLLAGDCLTTHALLQLTNSQAGGHLTPTTYSPHYRLKTHS
jgi:hypothetical protein